MHSQSYHLKHLQQPFTPQPSHVRGWMRNNLGGNDEQSGSQQSLGGRANLSPFGTFWLVYDAKAPQDHPFEGSGQHGF